MSTSAETTSNTPDANIENQMTVQTSSQNGQSASTTPPKSAALAQPTTQSTAQSDTGTQSEMTTDKSAGTSADRLVAAANTSSLVPWSLNISIAELLAKSTPVRNETATVGTMTDDLDTAEELPKRLAQVNTLSAQNTQLLEELSSTRFKHGDELKKLAEKDAEHDLGYRGRERKIDEVTHTLAWIEKVYREQTREVQELEMKVKNAESRVMSEQKSAEDLIQQLYAAHKQNDNHRELYQILNEEFCKKLSQLQGRINELENELKEKPKSSPADSADAEELARLQGLLELAKDIIRFANEDKDSLQGQLDEAKAAPELLKTERANFEKERRELKDEIRRLREELGRQPERGYQKDNWRDGMGGKKY